MSILKVTPPRERIWDVSAWVAEGTATMGRLEEV